MNKLEDIIRDAERYKILREKFYEGAWSEFASSAEVDSFCDEGFLYIPDDQKINSKQVSDGYHTFDALYEHRNILFLSLVNLWTMHLSKDILLHGSEFLPAQQEQTFNEIRQEYAYVVEDHYPEHDLIVLTVNSNPDSQISYHVPNRLRPLYTYLARRDVENHIWDRHTSKDVLQRLSEIVKDNQEFKF